MKELNFIFVVLLLLFFKRTIDTENTLVKFYIHVFLINDKLLCANKMNNHFLK